MDKDPLIQLRDRADRLALPMFSLSLLFLLLLAGLIVMWVDIPRVVELIEADGLDADGVGIAGSVHSEAILLANKAYGIGQILLIMMLCIWPVFWIELAATARTQKKSGLKKRAMAMPLMACLIPPLRLATVSPAWDNRIWLPTLSWQHPGRTLSNLLQRLFSKPMLLIALLILPVLLFQLVFKNAVNEHYWLRIFLHFSTGLIWFAFAFEFIIMISATDKKLSYIKKNWIDLAIIILPLISFLRSVRALRLAKLAKIQKIAKMGRIYRMRGLGMKAFKALLLFETVNRVLRIKPEKTLRSLQEKKAEMLLDLEEINEQIENVEARIANNQLNTPSSEDEVKPT